MLAKIPRRASRSLAFQVLYGQEFVACTSVEDLQRVFTAVPKQKEDASSVMEASGFAWDLVHGVWQKQAELDQVISKYARNWKVNRLGMVEKTLLRLAIFEILYRPDVPPKVAMNEALDLNHQFGEEKSRSFVNGILDSVCKALEDGKIVKNEE